MFNDHKTNFLKIIKEEKTKASINDEEILQGLQDCLENNDTFTIKSKILKEGNLQIYRYISILLVFLNKIRKIEFICN